MNRRNFIAALAALPLVRVNASKPVALHPAWIPWNLVDGVPLEVCEEIVNPNLAKFFEFDPDMNLNDYILR